MPSFSQSKRTLRPPTLTTCLAIVALAYALLAGLKTVVDFDLGWQMATGRYLLTHHAIPRTELFSYTAHGVEWIYPVLSGTVFYLLYQLGGYAALSWLCALTCVACAALLIYRRGFGATALALLAVPVLASEVMPRASLFTMLLVAAFGRILLEHFEGRRAPLWLLPALMLLWVNLHTGFIAGLILLAAYILVEALETPFPTRRNAALQRLKQALPWLLATACATLLNPWGPRIFLAIARQQSVVRWQSISLAEWQPVQLASALQELNWRTPDSARWWLLALGILLAAVCLWQRRIGPALVLAAASYAFLAHVRMEGPSILVICLIGGSILTPAAIQSILPPIKPAFTRSLPWALATLLTLLAAVRSFDVVTNRTSFASSSITLFGAGPSWWLPTQATSFLLDHHLSANVFSDFNLSSYLVWRLGDRYPDFADGRYLPFGETRFAQQSRLASLPLDSGEWTRTADAQHIHTVILPLSRVFALGDSPLLADCQSTLWSPVYMDTAAVIFERKPATQPTIDCRAQNLLASLDSTHQSARQYQLLANASALYTTLGRLPEAQDAAQRAETISSADPTLHFIKAQIAAAAHRNDQAEDELHLALNLRQTDAAWFNLALLYISEQRLPEAVQALQQSARLSQHPEQRYLLLARLYLAEQQPQQALDTFTQATRKSPYAPADSSTSAAELRAAIAEGQAAAYMQLQQSQKAVELQSFALRQTPHNPSRRQTLLQDCRIAQVPCPAQ